MTIISVVGARPNFMKMAPVHKAFQKYPDIRHCIVHTGQHYDDNMSKIFFTDLELPQPDFYLGVGSDSHAVQTAKIMTAFEPIVLKEKPGAVVVYGDVNSTVACALVASKLGIKVIHVESGLRSFDRTMPEEINRIITDSISDMLFVTEQSGFDNLQRENIPSEKIFFVGNTMIDSLNYYLPKIQSSKTLQLFGLEEKKFVLATLHRPSNVDDIIQLKPIMEQLVSIAQTIPVVFPLHPRTSAIFEKTNEGLAGFVPKNIFFTEPLGYVEFLAVMKNSLVVITDSGGIQEETTYLQIPCLTLRKNTERPVTIEQGTNELIGENVDRIATECLKIINGTPKKSTIPELWDGKSSERIAKIIYETNLKGNF